ncbi:MAG: hypothetical protein ACIAZJ_07680 [Gimesia chilikensis]|uniref:hypothetical protein n=1 Tax=Gimesia chilikensis TaxID=2605989 RepID=UPI0037B1718A
MMKSFKMILALSLVTITGLGVQQFVEAQQPQTEGSQRDQLRIAAQKICPVSGQKLGDHGKPIKVKVGKESVYLCCKGCLNSKVNPQHWSSIHANYAKAQGKCPVMKKQLPQKPKWTIVDGRIVYVCCPPCTKKIAADPEAYLSKVDDLYSANLQK